MNTKTRANSLPSTSDSSDILVLKMVDLPAAFEDIEDSDEEMKTRPLLQFISDWNHSPDSRDYMLSEALPRGCPRNWAAAIAAVVHALCERDGHQFPSSLEDLRADRDITITLDPVNSPYTRQIRSLANEACWGHKVFFPSELLEKR